MEYKSRDPNTTHGAGDGGARGSRQGCQQRRDVGQAAPLMWARCYVGNTGLYLCPVWLDGQLIMETSSAWE